MNTDSLGLLRFEDLMAERIWGGRKLETAFGKDLPPEASIGEDWLVSDHASAESVVAEGPLAGRTLHELLDAHGNTLLGTHAQPTVHGRFPLLLKLLDARDVLSVQVHPDDATAARLGEPDVGKTEMWHVLEAAPGSELICGLHEGAGPDDVQGAVADGSLPDRMVSFPVEPGDSVFVPAGTVHAIGGGILLAEIQQNSDLTYRLYDWGRLDDAGNARELHVEKSLESIHFGSSHRGKAEPLAYESGGTRRTVLAACRYFAAERVEVAGPSARETHGRSFHILLAVSGAPEVACEGTACGMRPGEAVLVPGCAPGFALRGDGVVLDYYVPNLRADVVEPLLAAGHDRDAIARLGGDPRESDLAGQT
jgi:mannose-6-phosphate isomerase